MGLAGVLDQRQPVLPANVQERVHVEGLAVKMDRQEGLGARRDGVSDKFRIQIEGGIVDVHIDRPGADV